LFDYYSNIIRFWGDLMDRREKRELREQEIVEKTISLFSQQGFLGVRMSDIAKQTQYSMGTIYSHFESKEDLLVACAHELVKDHQRLFEMVREQSIPTIEQIISLVQGVWTVATRFPDLIEIENLSLMHSIWKRATEQRVEAYVRLHENLAQHLRVMVLEAIGQCIEGYEDLEQDELEKMADYLTHGLWGLSVGLSTIVQSGYAASQCQEKEEEGGIEHFFATNYINMLKGYGWREESPEVVFERCSQISEQLLAQSVWFAPKRSGEQS